MSKHDEFVYSIESIKGFINAGERYHRSTPSDIFKLVLTWIASVNKQYTFHDDVFVSRSDRDLSSLFLGTYTLSDGTIGHVSSFLSDDDFSKFKRHVELLGRNSDIFPLDLKGKELLFDVCWLIADKLTFQDYSGRLLGVSAE